ncbi:MAG: hypothetical protein HY429_01915 [Candidatus Levybacteria bacterium]|nr:hypothetical protein [Candidatus Levybacteria bacterium]
MKRSPHGHAFGDSILLEKTSRHRFSYEDQSAVSFRGPFLLIMIIFFMGVLLFQLISLQVVAGPYYRGLSDQNRIRTTTIYAPRGILFDRNGTPLVFNEPGFRQTIDGKTQLLSHKEATEKLAQGKILEIDSLRRYPYKEAFTHVLGYVSQISEEELREDRYASYKPGDIIGKFGIEKQYENLLSGVDGKALSEVDATGKNIRTLGQTDPTSGKDISLTLDASLQQAAFLAMANITKGAVVATTPEGEVLALVSKPSFDPNLFTMGGTYKKEGTESAYFTVEEILNDSQNQPFLNRAIAGTYPPGSTFKLITAAKGLEDKAIDERFLVKDIGILQVGAFSFGNWYFLQYGKTEGEVNVVTAIKRSNDIFFYKLGEKLGVSRISQMAENFGLGKPLGIDLSGEAAGLVPSDSWKQKAIGEQWYLGDTYHYSIGQGYLLTTPLQVNSWTQVIANGGTLYNPHLLKNSKFEIRNSKFLSEKTISLIREGMVESCSPGGVAWPLFEFKVQSAKIKIDGKNFLIPKPSTTSASLIKKDSVKVAIACKTGTAQHGGEKDLPHAWITLFAPAYDPQIVLTVLAESSGEGSNVAAPIAKKILENWFSR